MCTSLHGEHNNIDIIMSTMSTHIPTHNACFKLVSESYRKSYTKRVPISLEPVCIDCALWKLAILRWLGCLPIHTIMTHQKVVLQSGNLEGVAHPPSPFCYSLRARRRSYHRQRRRVMRSGYGALHTLPSPLVMQQSSVRKWQWAAVGTYLPNIWSSSRWRQEAI